MPEQLWVYECDECGKRSLELGTLHAHIQTKHLGFFGFRLPWNTPTFQELMDHTVVIVTSEYERIAPPEPKHRIK